MKLATLALLAAVLGASAHAQTASRKKASAPAKPLDIYFIDMEGGHSTLYVMPNGQSILMDTGSPGARDHDRIMSVLTEAGVKELDYLVSTHYHSDHVGGVEGLAQSIPIKHYVDHGATVEEREQVPNFQKIYQGLYSKATRMIAKPGDRIPLGGVNVLVVTSHSKVLKTPLPGAGKPNPYCAAFVPRDESKIDPDNPNSVGLLFTYGKFRTINLGDFTWNVEKDLMCPNNPIGTVDLYLTSHHGIDQSGSATLVHALHPRVAIMHNGQRKGGVPQTMMTLETSPGLEDIWQLHWAFAGGTEYNAPGRFIANVEEPAALANIINPPPPPPADPNAPAQGRGRGPGRGGHTGAAFMIKVSARPDGSFTVTNTRNQFSKTYGPR